jgi:hypothetical protein
MAELEVVYHNGSEAHFVSLGLGARQRNPAFVVPENGGGELGWQNGDPAERWHAEMIATAYEEAQIEYAQREAEFDEALAMNEAYDDAMFAAARAENRRFDHSRGRMYNEMRAEANAENRERERVYVGRRRMGAATIMQTAQQVAGEHEVTRHRANETIGDRFRNARRAIGSFASRLVAPLRVPQVAMTETLATVTPITVEYRAAPEATPAPAGNTSDFSDDDLAALRSYRHYRLSVDHIGRGSQPVAA